MLPTSSVLYGALPVTTGTTLGDLVAGGALVSNRRVFGQTAVPTSGGT